MSTLVKQPLIKIHGGKWYLADWIISLFPANYKEMVYCEPFLGGGSVLLKKEKSREEFLYDLDFNLIKLWEDVQQIPEYFEDRLRELSYSKETFLNRNNIKTYVKGLAIYIKYRMSRGGMGKTFSWSDRLRGGKPGDVNAWENSINNIKNVSDRIIKCHFNIGNALDVLEFTDIDLFYLDPPYLPETRISKNVYDYEMTKQEHEIMLKKCIKFNPYQTKILISGYDNDMYNSYLSNWKKFTKEIANHSSQSKKKKTKTECIWRNF